jgi:hypothetical protein
MPSSALKRWQSEQSHKLDDLEVAHKALGGSKPGRRYLTQLNHAYLVMLAAQWQDFCRRLHLEAVDAIVRAVQPATVQAAVRASLTLGRSLDRGNATARAIGDDFGRFGTMRFWDLVDRQDRRNVKRRHRLQQLHRWRNAVAHQDFHWSSDDRRLLTGTNGSLDDVRAWRESCNALAQAMDRAVANQTAALIGQSPR